MESISKKRIKVLQIVRVPVGGIRKHIVSILRADNHELEFFLATDDSKGDLVYLADRGVERDHLFSLPIKNLPHPMDLLHIWKLYWRFRNEQIAVVHGHGAKGGLYARILGRLIGAKTFYTTHGGSIHAMHGMLFNSLYRLVEKLLYPLTDYLLFESEYTQKRYETIVHSKSPKMHLIYNGTEIFDYDNSPPKNYTVDSSIRLGAFGALRKIKGHALLIEALACLKKRYPKIELLLSGEGEEESELLLLAKKLGVEQSLIINKNSSDINMLMKSCDFILQPSYFESFGYVPVEAMALSKVVLTSRRGGLIEIVKDEKTGLHFDLTGESIASQVERLITDHDLRERIRRRGHEAVSLHFNEKVMVKRIVELYMVKKLSTVPKTCVDSLP